MLSSSEKCQPEKKKRKKAEETRKKRKNSRQLLHVCLREEAREIEHLFWRKHICRCAHRQHQADIQTPTMKTYGIIDQDKF